MTAADLTFQDSNTESVWDLTTLNWNDGAVKWTNANNATFGGTGKTVDVDAAISAVKMTFTVGGYTIADITNDGTLTLTGVGTGSTAAINANNAGITTISENIHLGAANGSTQQFNVAANGTLIVSGNITENASAGMILSLNGSNNSTLTLSGSNSYTGGTTTAASNLKLNVNNANALGTGALSITGGGTTIDNTSASAIILNNNALNLSSATVGSTSIHNLIFTGTEDLDFGTGAVTLSKGDKSIRINGGTLTLGGAIGEDGSARALFKNGVGILALTSDNSTYSGFTNINAGTLAVKSLADGNSNSSIGKSSKAAANLIIASGATLLYTGTGSSTDRSFTTAAGITGATIDASGSGALKFTDTGGAVAYSGVLTSARALTLAGTNTDDNTMALAIGDTGTTGGTMTVTKSDTGKWILSGANTYTGKTLINGGTLQFAKKGSLYNSNTTSWTSTNIVVASGATAAFNVGGTGEFASADIDILKGLGTSAATGFRSGSSLGLDTSNASGGNFTYGGVIANTNSGANVLGLVKLGANTLTLTGANTYTGGTIVKDGTLIVTGAIGGSTTVKTGATLGGTGSFGAVTVEGGGRLTSGDSLGHPVATSLNVRSGGFYVADVKSGAPDAGATYSQLTLTGSADDTAETVLTLDTAASILKLDISGGFASNASAATYYDPEGPNSTFDNYFIFNLTDSVDLISGRFAFVQDASGNEVAINYENGRFLGINGIGTFELNGQEYAISYGGDFATNATFGGNDVVLTAIPEPNTWAMLAGGVGILAFIQRLRRRATNPDSAALRLSGV